MLRFRPMRVAPRYFPRNNERKMLRWRDHSPRGAGNGKMTARKAVAAMAGTVACCPHLQHAPSSASGTDPIWLATTTLASRPQPRFQHASARPRHSGSLTTVPERGQWHRVKRQRTRLPWLETSPIRSAHAGPCPCWSAKQGLASRSLINVWPSSWTCQTHGT